MTVTQARSDAEEIGQRLGEAAYPLADRTIVLTGANGFLGLHFLTVFGYLNEHVLPRPCHVVAMDVRPWDATSDSTNVRYVEHDVTQPFQIEGDVHYVIHAAGNASPQNYRARPLETIDVSTIGTRNLLDLAMAHGARFLFFSSSEIYGDPDPRHVPTPESYRGNVASQGPRACYDESKRLGETLCYVYHERFGIHTNVVRPFNVFGPGMSEMDHRVLPNFASRLKRGLPLEIYGHGTQTRTYCYVTDALVGFVLTLLRGGAGRTYNIGNPDQEVSVLDLARIMERIVGHPLTIRTTGYPSEYPADEPTRRCPDITKAVTELGYRPLVPLEEGLRRFWAWTNVVYGSGHDGG